MNLQKKTGPADAGPVGEINYYALKWSFEPSVAQPPLPLQSFLPLQPLALALQPPWPLQSFLPLQECLSPSSIAAFAIETFPAAAFMTLALAVIPEWDAGVGAACNLAVVPPKRPDTAAVIITFLTEFFIKLNPFARRNHEPPASLPGWALLYGSVRVQ
jgi:hypothetical protein